MTEQTSIAGPVNVVSDSRERVAFELMCKIDDYSQLERKQKDNKYWLTLYSQCLKAMKGKSPEDILNKS